MKGCSTCKGNHVIDLFCRDNKTQHKYTLGHNIRHPVSRCCPAARYWRYISDDLVYDHRGYSTGVNVNNLHHRPKYHIGTPLHHIQSHYKTRFAFGDDPIHLPCTTGIEAERLSSQIKEYIPVLLLCNLDQCRSRC